MKFRFQNHNGSSWKGYSVYYNQIPHCIKLGIVEKYNKGWVHYYWSMNDIGRTNGKIYKTRYEAAKELYYHVFIERL